MSLLLPLNTIVLRSCRLRNTTGRLLDNWVAVYHDCSTTRDVVQHGFLLCRQAYQFNAMYRGVT
jgi:hypothetical protein